jgi:FG-GAP repeat protein
MRRLALVVSFVLVSATLIAGPFASTASAASKVRSDFNGDGRADLAIGVAAEDLEPIANAGAVNVIYGGTNGLRSLGNQFWSQASPGVPTDPEANGNFGAALATGNFNGDGFADLAIGVPGATVSGQSSAGLVIVLYGSRNGLTSNGSQLFDQDTEQVQDTAETSDGFGSSLAAGNFGRSGQDDLAIGVPGQDVGAAANAGVVHVLYGSITGLTANDNQLWSQDSPGMQGDGAETGDNFGSSAGVTGMVAANFGKTSQADLAIGVPREDVGAVADAGAVNVLYGSPSGLSTAGSQFWTQDSPNVKDDSETGDLFGITLGAANFGKSGQADLAIGVPVESVNGIDQCGAVNVLYGGTNGLTANGNQFWNQDVPGVKDQCDPQGGGVNGDIFGYSIATGNFGKSTFADLAVAAVAEDIGSALDAGAVNVIYGGTNGLRATGNQLWSQNSPNVKDKSEGPTGGDNPDFFGFSMFAANFGKSTQADLAIAAVGEDLAGNTILDAGAVNVLYGALGGLGAAGNQFWNQDSPNIKDQAETGDFFGFAQGRSSERWGGLLGRS